MLIDTHCHLVSHRYEGVSPEEMAARAAARGVGHCVSLGTERADWEAQLELGRRLPSFVTPCLAVHPTEAHLAGQGDMELLRQLASERPVGAVGEAGLDYYWPAPEGWTEDAYHRRQCELLEAHFEIARDLGLNISLHTRDRKGAASFEDAVAIARRYPTVRSVFHCFIGDREQAGRVFDELDGLVSFTGIVTFKNAPVVHDVAAWCPLDRFLVETDAPYLAPEPVRGSVNEPACVRFVAERVALLRGVPVEEIEEATSATARRFFRLAGETVRS